MALLTCTARYVLLQALRRPSLYRRALCSQACSPACAAASLQADLSAALVWPDRTRDVFHAAWLRDHCCCLACRHPTNLERNVDTCSPAVSAVPLEVTLEDEGRRVCFEWADGHQTAFSTEWLWANRYSNNNSSRFSSTSYGPMLPPALPWDNASLRSCTKFPEMSFDDFEKDEDEAHRSILLWLRRHGLAIIHGVPPYRHASKYVLKAVGGVHRMLFGEVWLAVARNDPDDQAFSRDDIAPHTDGSFLHDVPAVQMLHCYSPAEIGGLSRFLDGFFVANKLRRQHPDAFEFLSSTPLRYHYYIKDIVENKMAHAVMMRKTFGLNDVGEVVNVCHNSYHRAPLNYLAFDEVPRFYNAMRILQAELDNPENVFEVHLAKGSLVLVDNHRILHARSAFQGTRVMAAGYMNRDQLEHSMRRLLGDDAVRSLC